MLQQVTNLDNEKTRFSLKEKTLDSTWANYSLFPTNRHLQELRRHGLKIFFSEGKCYPSESVMPKLFLKFWECGDEAFTDTGEEDGAQTSPSIHGSPASACF